MSDSTPVKKEVTHGAPEKINGLTQRDLEILSKAWGAMKAQPEVSAFIRPSLGLPGATPTCRFLGSLRELSVTPLSPGPCTLPQHKHPDL